MRPVLVVVVAAVAVRAAAFAWASDPGLDFDKFLILADRLQASGWLPTAPFAYSPAYIYLVAIVRTLLGTEPARLAAVQIALDCAVVVAVWSLARHTWGRQTAVVASIATVFAAPLVLHAVDFESDGLGLALTLSATAAAAAGCRRDALLWPGVAGLLLGLRTCQRPNGAAVVLGFALVLALLRWSDRRRRLTATAVLMGAAALPVAGVMAVNFRAAGELVPVMSSAGWVLYTSHNHAARGLGYAPPPLALELKRDPMVDPVARMDEAVSRRIAAWVTGHRLGAAAASRFWRGEALRSIRRRGAWSQLRRQLARLWFAIHRYEAVDNPAAAARWQRLRQWPLLGAGLLLPLGLAGLVRRALCGASWQPAEALLVVVAATSITTMSLFYVGSRFRLELVAAAVLFAAWGTVDVIAARGHRRRLATSAWLAALGMALAVSNLPSKVVEAHARRALIRVETVRGDHAADIATAVAHYRQATATAVYPAEAAPAFERLAALLPALGEHHEARVAARLAAGLLTPEATRRFTALPDDPDAQWALGCQALVRRQPGAAAAAFNAALASQPDNPEYELALAVALEVAGGAPAATIRDLVADALDDGLRFTSDAPRGWRLLARQAAALGDQPAAAAAAREAARLDADYSTLLAAPAAAASGANSSS